MRNAGSHTRDGTIGTATELRLSNIEFSGAGKTTVARRLPTRKRILPVLRKVSTTGSANTSVRSERPIRLPILRLGPENSVTGFAASFACAVARREGVGCRGAPNGCWLGALLASAQRHFQSGDCSPRSLRVALRVVRGLSRFFNPCLRACVPPLTSQQRRLPSAGEIGLLDKWRGCRRLEASMRAGYGPAGRI